MNIKIGIAGGGRVGSYIFNVLKDNVASFLQHRKDIYNPKEECDIWVLSLPEDAILNLKDKYIKLARTGVVHTSGTASKIVGVFKAHPYAMFGLVSELKKENILWGVPEDEKNGVGEMFAKDIMKGKVFYLPEKYDPIKYHTSAVLSSSLLYALLSISKELFDKMGIEDISPIISIAKQAIEMIGKDCIEEYMSGPVLRKDWITVFKETESLKEIDEECAKIYELLSYVLDRRLK